MYKVDFKSPCHVHFIGIGGISMSGLAEILIKEGFTVTGSDIEKARGSETIHLLQDKGVKIYFGQVAENLIQEPGTALVVYTAAISSDNEELLYAKSQNIPLLTRAELLGQIMENYRYSIAVAGTHGKTTTTSMVSYVLDEAKKDPTISIGGMLELIGGNIRVGSSPYFVTEACEYTNSYHAFNPLISIILNIDNDHLDFFHNIENIAKSFATFATKVKDGGILIVNGDMEYTAMIKEAVAGRNIQVVTFGLLDSNDYQARNIELNGAGHPSYDLYHNGTFRCRISLKVTGEHNAVNSLSVIAAADFLSISEEAIKNGFENCKSANRRFQLKGTYAGTSDKPLKDGVTVVDDYAHHPTEIAATLKVANSVKKGELWVAFQPHTYSRTYAHLEEFIDALSVCDHVLLADIYAARELDDGKVSSRDIEEGLKKKGCDAVYLGSYENIKKYFKQHCSNNDLFITMGAGPIDFVGDSLLSD